MKLDHNQLQKLQLAIPELKITQDNFLKLIISFKMLFKTGTSYLTYSMTKLLENNVELLESCNFTDEADFINVLISISQ